MAVNPTPPQITKDVFKIEEKKEEKFTKFFYFTLVIIIIGGIVGGIFFYFPNLFGIGTEFIIYKSIENTFNIETYGIEAEAEINGRFPLSSDLQRRLFGSVPNLSKQESSDIALTLHTDSGVDASDKESIKTKNEIRVSLKLEGVEIYTTFDLLFSNNDSYLLLKEFPTLGLLNVGNIKRKWIKIDDESYDNMLLRYNVDKKLLSTEGDGGGYEGVEKQTIKDIPLDFFNIRLNSKDTLDGYGVYYYIVDINVEKFKERLQNLEEINKGRKLIKSELDNYDKFFRSVNNLSLNLWIDQKDTIVRQATLAFDYSDPTLVVANLLHIKFNLKLTDLNKKIEINKPELATDIFRDLSGQMAPLSRMKNVSLLQNYINLGKYNFTLIFDFDNDYLADVLEIFYGTNSLNSDSDADGLLDGQEVRQSSNPSGKFTLGEKDIADLDDWVKNNIVNDYNNRALALFQEGQESKALEFLNKSIELQPNYSQSYLNLAKYYYQSFELYNQYSQADFEKGLADRSKENNKKAEEYLEKSRKYLFNVLELDTPNVRDKSDTYLILGLISRYEKDWNRAIDYYQKAINADPSYADAYYYMGVLYRSYLNNSPKASWYYSKALELSPEDFNIVD